MADVPEANVNRYRCLRQIAQRIGIQLADVPDAQRVNIRDRNYGNGRGITALFVQNNRSMTVDFDDKIVDGQQVQTVRVRDLDGRFTHATVNAEGQVQTNGPQAVTGDVRTAVRQALDPAACSM